MSYDALPDMRMPYDNDGTVYAIGDMFSGVLSYPTGSQALHANGGTPGSPGDGGFVLTTTVDDATAWLFFPELREVTAYYAWAIAKGGIQASPHLIEGSADSTNGLDGTWETAGLGGASTLLTAYDWRSGIKSVSFTGPKRVVRFRWLNTGSGGVGQIGVSLLHLYGDKAAGQTPDDVIFIDHDTTGAEYTAPEDFGDRPLGTTVVREFRVKNASATKTANSINLQCNDADFAISTDNSTWVTTINIASLGAGAESATLYIRNSTPAPGNVLRPRFARIIAIVGSWT